MKASTLPSRESVLATHIRPFFGSRLLREINVALIRGFVKTLVTKELSPKTISNVLGILKTMCKHAVQWGISTPIWPSTWSGRAARSGR